MLKKILFVSVFCFSLTAFADNVILLIGDGMGVHQVRCIDEKTPLFLSQLPVKGSVKTTPANADVTDSAAAATAYACGVKTNNKYLGMTPDNKPCQTLAERAIEKGYFVGIRSSDMRTGATPSAFYSHTTNRRDVDKIESFLKKASRKMDIQLELKELSDSAEKLFQTAGRSGKPFFLMLEASDIDIESHRGDLDGLQTVLRDFDKTVQKAVQFAEKTPDTTVVVIADHETGGLNADCVFTTPKHTAADVPLFVTGAKAHLFQSNKPFDNTEIHHKINEILFDK